MKNRLLIVLCVFLVIFIIAVFIAFAFIIKPFALNQGGNLGAHDTKIIEIEEICQFPHLPTGCEATAATMVLNYYGENISIKEFAANWLSFDENFYYKNDKLYGPNPDKVFVGNPFTKNSYGCYSTPIINAINQNSLHCIAKPIRNQTLAELCETYINNNCPIIIWATMGMKPMEFGSVWYTNDNQKITWRAGEHCLVLVGFDKDFYFFADPQSGSVVGYKKNIAEKRFNELDMQGIYVSPKEKAVTIK